MSSNIVLESKPIPSHPLVGIADLWGDHLISAVGTLFNAVNYAYPKPCSSYVAKTFICHMSCARQVSFLHLQFAEQQLQGGLEQAIQIQEKST